MADNSTELLTRMAVMETNMAHISAQVEANTAAVSEFTKTIAEFKGGKAALFAAFGVFATIGAGAAWLYSNILSRKGV